MIDMDVVIYGAGGLGREVLWALRQPEVRVADPEGLRYIPNIVGFIDSNADNHGETVNETTVLGGWEWIRSHPEVLAVVAVGIPNIREQVVARLRSTGVTFASVVSQQSIIGEGSSVGEGSIVLPGAVVTSNVEIGKFVLLNPTASVSHDCAVGDYTSLGPGVSLAGNVVVGNSCDIGTNASAIPGVVIGSNSVVGAGACVTEDLPDNITAVGVPARVIESR